MPISLHGWASDSATQIREDGLRGVANSLYDIYLGGFLSLSSRFSVGTNVFDRDWDALIILDACRVDALRTVANEYAFLDEVKSMRSVGSSSCEWLSKTFVRSHQKTIDHTAYVCGNPYPQLVFEQREHPPLHRTIPFGPHQYDVVEKRDFAYLDEVSTYGVDEEVRTIRPRTITDRAIRAGREEEFDRLIVHYMQPHAPYIDEEYGVGTHVMHRLQNGDLSLETAWQSYLANLRLVLDEVELLIENLDADRVVVSADHGEAFGELGFFGHTDGFPHPAVKCVPWVETTATDRKTFEPHIDPSRDVQQTNLDEHLKDLGYLE